jgi:hypothetical protein
VDLIVIVQESTRSFEERGSEWDALALPVPADVIVYTRDEWERMRATGSRFAREVEREAIWVWPAGEAAPG